MMLDWVPSVVHHECGYGADSSLNQAAKTIAKHFYQQHRLPDTQVIEWLLRRSRSAHVWPRVFGIQGSSSNFGTTRLKEQIRQWLGVRASTVRCGIASHFDYEKKRIAFVLIAVEPQAELEPLPEQVRAHTWLTLRANLREVAYENQQVRVLVLPPTGQPKTILSSLSHQHSLRAQFSLSMYGRYVVQVVADSEQGSRPILETDVYVETPPPLNPDLSSVPGEDSMVGKKNLQEALFLALNSARAHELLNSLQRDEQLDALAYSHAVAMIEHRSVSHNLGNGDARARMHSVGIYASNIGENIARAKDIRLAHRMLYASASHRANMLDTRFRSVGVAAIRDPKTQDIWVTQIFRD